MLVVESKEEFGTWHLDWKSGQRSGGRERLPGFCTCFYFWHEIGAEEMRQQWGRKQRCQLG